MIDKLSDVRREIILAFADCNMNLTDTGRKLYMHRNTIVYNLERTKAITGLNPYNFYELIRLVEEIRKPIEEKAEEPIGGNTLCEDCGKLFEGGKNAHYCPECRRRRQIEGAKKRDLSKLGNAARSMKARGRNGT